MYVLLHCSALVFCHSKHFFFVIPNASEESSVDASLHSAWQLRGHSEPIFFGHSERSDEAIIYVSLCQHNIKTRWARL